ncbi:hypothetical protein K437DRAFT_48877 [Tilletiaria anomala UBC 951]|uniref:Transcription activator of gluconeogenesis ERT1 n=1 Tax=Tilletiaria anomala (strain ATCC 24038 / CBS 436.72 / UBC 951) TaxID=1037660 RepID=A0A066V4W8_TILAU|nr:uncharacterized protein K437DRAFT_48877 [Tilletiaria anomala UBC 951]KDN36772.1 hypothetical protein K437DRAFT_48877 [Tilletiaria anomala UBC 951]
MSSWQQYALQAAAAAETTSSSAANQHSPPHSHPQSTQLPSISTALAQGPSASMPLSCPSSLPSALISAPSPPRFYSIASTSAALLRAANANVHGHAGAILPYPAHLTHVPINWSSYPAISDYSPMPIPSTAAAAHDHAPHLAPGLQHYPRLGAELYTASGTHPHPQHQLYAAHDSVCTDAPHFGPGGSSRYTSSNGLHDFSISQAPGVSGTLASSSLLSSTPTGMVTMRGSSPLAPPKAKRKQVKNACTNCQKACKKCDEGRPCSRCVKYHLEDSCENSLRKERKRGIKRGPYKRRATARTALLSTDANAPSAHANESHSVASLLPHSNVSAPVDGSGLFISAHAAPTGLPASSPLGASSSPLLLRSSLLSTSVPPPTSSPYNNVTSLFPSDHGPAAPQHAQYLPARSDPRNRGGAVAGTIQSGQFGPSAGVYTQPAAPEGPPQSLASHHHRLHSDSSSSLATLSSGSTATTGSASSSTLLTPRTPLGISSGALALHYVSSTVVPGSNAAVSNGNGHGGLVQHAGPSTPNMLPHPAAAALIPPPQGIDLQTGMPKPFPLKMPPSIGTGRNKTAGIVVKGEYDQQQQRVIVDGEHPAFMQWQYPLGGH